MTSQISVNTFESKSGNPIDFSGKVLDFSRSDQFLSIPSGTTAERGVPIEGGIRWNTDINNLEAYDGELWKPFRILKVNEIVEQTGLQLSLDSSNSNSYPGFERKWYDETAQNNYKAILQNSPTYSTNFEGILSFNGTNQYALVEVDQLIQPANGISQEVWFRTTDISKTQVFIGHQYGISTDNSYALWLDSGSSQWRAGVNLSGTFDTIQLPFSSFGVSNNTWYQFVHVYSGTSYTKTFQGTVTTLSNIIEDCINIDIDLIVGSVITGTGMGDPAVNPTTITNIDYVNNRVTLSSPATVDAVGTNFVSTIEPSHFLYINGQLRLIKQASGTITYSAENTSLVIGADFNGPGANTGLVSHVQGDIPIVRIYNTRLVPSSVKNNYDVIKSRFGLT